MQIFVQGDATGTYDISPVVCVKDLKQFICFRTGVSAEEQVLIFAGKPLDDDKNLSFYELNENSTVSLSKRLLGGK